MALAQLFYLREAIRRRARNLRHRWASRPVTHNRNFMLEPLEGRLLLSADLTGVVTAHTLLDPSVPTNAEQATIRVINSGDAKTAQVSQVTVYASLDNTLDAGDVLLGTANVPKTISAGQFKDVNVALQMPNTLAAGTYNLLARVDTTNVVVEGTTGEANNLTVGPQFQVAWQFGAVPGRAGNTTLTLNDADGTRVTFSLSGPGLGEVIKDGSNWDVQVTGSTASSAVTIATNSVGNGRVTLNDVHVVGPLAAFTAAKADLSGTLAIDGPVNIPGLLPGTITLGSIQGGTLAVPSVEALTILGAVTNAKIYIGTTLGQDGQPGGTGAPADTYGPGRIGLVTVAGSMTGTTVRVGIDPVDGVYGNGNDTLIGAAASSIGGIIIGGTLSADTHFIAGAFPAKYLVGGNLRPTAGDPHFISNFSGPSLTAALQQDTGTSPSDRITNTPTIVGSLTDPDGIATFTAGFGATPTFNVLADRQADGSFTLTRTRLEQIIGDPLTDGTYILTLQATDTMGQLAQTTVSFTLDSTLATPTLNLDLASDSAPTGDQQTVNAIVMLVGHTEANALVELLGLGLTTTADGTGTFSFSNLALTLGANTFTARATDQAGNQQTTGVTITRLLADSDGDGTPDSQETGGPNGGDANNDGIPDSQQANVVSVLNSANQYVTLVAPAGAIFTGAQSLGNPSPSDAPADVTFPLGFVAFQLTGLVEGAATVDLLLPDGTEANTYWQYGATPDNATPHWYEFLYDGTTGAEINGNTVTLYFQDGARGDSDLTVNGTIVDPSGPGFVVNHAPSGTDKTITINEDTPYTFTTADFGFSDVLDNPANNFQAVTITSLPSAGTLTLNGVPVNVGDSITNPQVGVTWTARESSRRWHDVASSADGTKLIAASSDGLYTSTNSGLTWTARESNRGWTPVASSADGTKLVAGSFNGQLYTSTDSGVTWTAHLEDAGWTAIASSADGTKLIAAAQGLMRPALYMSTDGGETWRGPESGVPFSTTTWTDVASSADGTKLVATSASGFIHTSTDSGVNWTAHESRRQWWSVASSADGTKLVAADAAGRLYTSTDSGVTWTARASNQSWTDVASSADGTKLVAAATNGRQLYTSTDSGVTWSARASNQNWTGVASSADGTKLIAAVFGGQLYTSAASPGPVFMPALNANGTPYTSFTLQVQDNGGTRNGGVDLDPSANTITINVTPVNDAPVNVLPGGQITLEDTALLFTTANGNLITVNDVDTAALTVTLAVTNGTLTLGGTTGLTGLTGNGTGTVSFGGSITDINAALIGLSYLPTLNFNGLDILRLTTTDGVATPVRSQVGISVAPVDDAPVTVVVPGAQMTLEDTALLFTTANGNLISVNDVATATVSIILAVTNGSLTLGGTTGLIGLTGNGTGTVSFAGSVTDINAALTGLSYLPNLSYNGSDSLRLTASNGVSVSVLSTVALTVTSVNYAPAGADKTIAMPEDTAYAFTLADFGFTDPNDSPADNFQAVTITSLPSTGTLTLNGTPVNVGDSITIPPAGETWTARESGDHLWWATASSADGTKLVATSTPSTFNTDGQIYTSTDAGVTWTARESDRQWRGVASSADGMKLVAAVTGEGGRLYTSTDAGVTWTARASNTYWWSVASSADGTKLVATTTSGQLWTSTDSGVTWTARESVREWFSVASSADGTKLIAADNNGFLYTSTDSGVTWKAREEARGWYAVASSANGTKLIAAVTGGHLYTSTDSGVTWTAHLSSSTWTSVASSANGTTLIAGNYNELWISTDSGATWTQRTQGALAYWYAVSSSADGTKLVAASQGSRLYTSDVSLGLVFTPDVNTNGIPYASFTFQVQDDGGTLNGGVDLDPTPNRITINVTALANVVPGAQTTLEDAALLFNTANGNPISVSDLDTATVTVTLSVTNGALTLAGTTGLTGLTGNGTGLVSFVGNVTDINAALNGLSFLPTPNFNGSDTLTLTTADGVATPVLSTVALTITSVNDAPAGEDQTITTPEDTAYVFTVEDFSFSDPSDSPANNFKAVTITSLPSTGTLTLDGTPVNVGDSIPIPPAGGTWTPLTTPILSQGQSWYDVASSADGTKLVATAYGGQLYTSTDAGVTWTARANDQYWVSVASSADGTHLVAAVAGGFLYTSTDAGETWTERANDLNRNWWSVASSVDGTKLVATGYDGLYTSTDAGVTWTARQGGSGWFAVASSADGTKLIATVYSGQLYTSTDSGVTWTAREENRFWYGVASSADGMKLIAAADGGQLYTSTDAGVTWTAREEVRHWQAVVSSADGTKLVAAAHDGLYTSRDSGATWAVHPTSFNWINIASSADGTKLIASSGESRLYTSNSSIGLVFTPDINATGSPYTSFTFKVQDDEDTLNGGENVDPLANTITINVTA